MLAADAQMLAGGCLVKQRVLAWIGRRVAGVGVDARAQAAQQLAALQLAQVVGGYSARAKGHA